MRLKTLIELRRHIRAIDIVLKDEIDHEKVDSKLNIPSPGVGSMREWCGHPTCDPLIPCRHAERYQELARAAK